MSMAGGRKVGRVDEATVEWLRGRFRRYYATTPLDLPDRYNRREFGFMHFPGGIVQRHLGFARASDLQAFVADRVPAHAYYSSAYYERPDAPTMDEKGWLGADLIFDLDADHIPGADRMRYEDTLEAVKEKVVHLYDGFLRSDLGFDESRMRIAFSGGRGYHIHVFDPRVWSLGSHERREIVDYVTGKGIDLGRVFRKSAFDSREFRGAVRVKTRVVAPPSDEPGWPGKIARGMLELARKLEPMAHDDAVAFLTSFEGVRESDAEDLWENLFKPRTAKPRTIRGVDRLLEGGPIETLADRSRDLLIRIVTQLQQVRLDTYRDVPLKGITQRAETDEPVTSDTKRLIRLPSSLHGKTGFRVVPLTRDAIDAFRPLRDAVPATWSEEPVRVHVRSKCAFEIRDRNLNLEEGIIEVPEYAAVFLACRGLAAIAA